MSHFNTPKNDNAIYQQTVLQQFLKELNISRKYHISYEDAYLHCPSASVFITYCNPDCYYIDSHVASTNFQELNIYIYSVLWCLPGLCGAYSSVIQTSNLCMVDILNCNGFKVLFQVFVTVCPWFRLLSRWFIHVLCARSVFMHAFGQASQRSSCCMKREQLDVVVCRPRMRMLRFLICGSKLLKDWYAFFKYWKRQKRYCWTHQNWMPFIDTKTDSVKLSRVFLQYPKLSQILTV